MTFSYNYIINNNIIVSIYFDNKSNKISMIKMSESNFETTEREVTENNLHDSIIDMNSEINIQYTPFVMCETDKIEFFVKKFMFNHNIDINNFIDSNFTISTDNNSKFYKIIYNGTKNVKVIKEINNNNKIDTNIKDYKVLSNFEEVISKAISSFN